MDRPLVFARERPSLAVNARDYISLVAVDVNRGGQHQLYWYGYVWTTIDDGGQLAAAARRAEWLLLADTRPIAAAAVDRSRRGTWELVKRHCRVRSATRPLVLFAADGGRAGLR